MLPEVMRENGVEMWITMIREANYGNLWPDFGFGYASTDGFYIFTDRGEERIERAALGVSGYLIERSGAYDLMLPADALADFVRERDPKTHRPQHLARHRRRSTRCRTPATSRSSRPSARSTPGASSLPRSSGRTSGRGA